MIDLKGLKGFRQVKRLFQSERSLILRACREEDGVSVILKTVIETRPSLETVARLEREFRLGSGLAVEGVVRYLERRELGGKPLLVLEDVGCR